MALKKQFLKTKPVCKVTFHLAPECLPDARQVHVVGEFNGWDVASHPMKRLKDGGFSLQMNIPSGKEYRFRYFVDNARWANEPEADGYEYCHFAGCDNSLLNI